jgi:Domain of unknown function (DUF4263)
MLNHGLHFDVMISKFPLDTSLKSDFAYRTKSTGEWYLTLMELEHPSKAIFTNNKVPTFSANFNAAIGQIDGWKAFIEQHSDEDLTPPRRARFALETGHAVGVGGRFCTLSGGILSRFQVDGSLWPSSPGNV